MASLLAEDSAHRILSCRDPKGRTIPSGRPHVSWLRQMEAYLEDMGMADLASALAMTRGRPKEYRRKVDAATNIVCPIPDLTLLCYDKLRCSASTINW